MEEMVMVESKDYAQVVFDDVKECFTENHPLECEFSLNELLKADSSDLIGIFKVGFSNFKDYICSQPVNVNMIDNHKGKVVFNAETLPKDDGEFYQFVYVSQSKQIRGASIPFQFKRTHLSDYIEVEDHEAVLIKSKETAINETINEIKSRCAHLTEANQTYEKLVKENEELIHVLKDEVSSIKVRCIRLTMDNEKLNYTLTTKADSVKALTATINNLTDENNKLQIKFDDLTNENKNLLESLQQRIDQITQLKSDLESVKSDQITNLEKQVDQRVEELNQIKCDLKRNEMLVSEQTLTIQNILSEKNSLNNLIQKLTKEKNDLEYNQENLSQELNMSKDKLMAAEQCKEMLRAQLVVLTDELKEASSTIEAHSKSLLELKNQKKQDESDKAELVEKIGKIKMEYESKLEESNGSYYALKLAHVHLENKLKASEQTKVRLDKDNEMQKACIEKLKTENQELKERIQAGAKEYSKLFEKYRLLKNQQFNYDMNLYQDLNGEDILIRKDANVRISHQRHMQFMGTSTPNSNSGNNDQEQIDSAIQEKTLSQSGARASSADIENTLLDALLGSSFGWNKNEREINNSIRKEQSTIVTASPTTSVATTQQPKTSKQLNDNQTSNMGHHHQANDLSDDGLINLNSNAESNFESEAKSNLIENLSSCKPIDFINLRAEYNRNVNLMKRNSQSKDDDDVFTEQNSQLLKLIECNNKTNACNTTKSDSKASNMDAMNIRTCDICQFIFPTDFGISEIEKHYSLHYGPSCPVCFLLFRKGYPQNEYEDHVNSHFVN